VKILNTFLTFVAYIRFIWKCISTKGSQNNKNNNNNNATSSTAGAATEGTAHWQELQYQSIAHTNTSITLAFETLEQINSKGTDFLINLVDASQLALATSKKQSSHFNACR